MRSRRLGQHFLNSTRLAERIARTAGVENELVVEIGPGKGILTKQLARIASRVVAVEIDSRLAASLGALRIPRVDVLNLDFLKVDLRNFDHPVIVGNIPYGITSAITEKLILGKKYLKQALLTVQKEYGSKMTATLGHPQYGYTSICVNYHFDICRHFAVAARYFSPKPKVSSVVVTLRPKEGVYDQKDELGFFEFVAGVFRYRRKSLKNAILNYLGWYPQEMDNTLLAKRPQDLRVDDYYRIYTMVSGER